MDITTIVAHNGTTTFTTNFKIVGSSIYLCLLFIALWLNIFQMAVYIKGHQTFKSLPFFIIAWQLLINDIMICCVHIIFNLMIVAQSFQFSLSVRLNSGLAFVESFSYNGLLCFAFILCLNRLTVFATPKINRFLFDRPRIFGVIVFVWIYVSIMVTGIMNSPCPIEVNFEALNFNPRCIVGGNIYNKIGLYLATYIPIVMLIIYFLIFLELKVGIFNNIRCCRPLVMPGRYNNQEIRLLIQSFLICGTFFIQNFAWSYLPFITDRLENGNEIKAIVIMLASVLLFSVDAIVMLTFNNTVKEVSRSFLKRSTATYVSVYSIQPKRQSVVAPVNMLLPFNACE